MATTTHFTTSKVLPSSIGSSLLKFNVPANTPDGVAIARVIIKHIAIVPQDDGTKAVHVQDGDRTVQFFLDMEQCAHLAALLTA